MRFETTMLRSSPPSRPRIRRACRRLGAIVLVVAAGIPGAPAIGAATGSPAPGANRPAGDPPSLPGDWYYAEVIVFQRPAVSLPGIDEQLVTDLPRTLPAGITSLESPGADRAVFYSGDPAVAACITVARDAPNAGAGAPRALGLPLVPSTAPDPRADANTAADAADPDAAIAAPAAAPAAAPDPVQLFEQALADFAESIREQSFAWLPASGHTLAREASRLAANHQILLHRRWVQSVPARGAPRPILVQGGVAAGAPALEGTLLLTRGRFLHFDATLWYRDDRLAATPDQYVLLRESRRMRRGELHYLDHPKLGVIVRASPVTLPDALIEAHAALSVDPLPPEDVEPPDEPDGMNEPDTLDLPEGAPEDVPDAERD